MKITLIGSGLIGLTTAYFLRQSGHDVTVLDAEPGPARQTSWANGGLLTPSMAEPWNTPGSWRVLLSSFTRRDSPLQLRLRAMPSLASWGLEFLRQSTPVRFERNTLANLRLSLYSLEVLQQLREQTRIDYGRSNSGALKIFRNPKALDSAAVTAEQHAKEGLQYRRLSPTETVDLEPALAPIATDLSGALHFPADETGDARVFCVSLAELLRQMGVELRYHTRVTAIEMHDSRIGALKTQNERLTSDAYVIAAGSDSALLAGMAGLKLPVQPAKGYSITFENPEAASILRIPIVDDDWHAAVVPLPGGLRVAGTAEFAGFDRALNPDRIRNLRKLVRQLLPSAPLDFSSATPWCGLRAMSADGVPIIGPTPISNLFINTGHGHLGWTMASGAAHLLADLITQNRPAIDPAPFAFSRFCSGAR